MANHNFDMITMLAFKINMNRFAYEQSSCIIDNDYQTIPIRVDCLCDPNITDCIQCYPDIKPIDAKPHPHLTYIERPKLTLTP